MSVWQRCWVANLILELQVMGSSEINLCLISTGGEPPFLRSYTVHYTVLPDTDWGPGQQVMIPATLGQIYGPVLERSKPPDRGLPL